MHYGSDPDAPPDPWVDELQLQEIENCWTVSRGCFFIVSIESTIRTLLFKYFLLFRFNFFFLIFTICKKKQIS